MMSAESKADLITAFADHGLVLTEDVEVRKEEPDNSWTLIDHAHARCFRLCHVDKQLQVFAGGESYQLQNFEFWKIHYYPETESWEIAKGDGITSVYGGLAQDTTSHGLTWGVRWGAWIGSSNITQNEQGEPIQQRYVTLQPGIL